MGLFMTCVGLWFALAVVGRPPFTTIWLRASVIGVVVAIAAIIACSAGTVAAAPPVAIERDLLAPRATGDAEVLSERMGAALDTLRKAGGKTYLYDLPWYVIIGPPGAGKTTALRNSGLEFPGSRLEAVEGLSGTRNCDWWFTEEAVLIDTAGRYTTQDSDAASDAASWTAFLQLLKRHRPRQPINGVILTFSCEDLMGAEAEDLAKHASTVRQRLSEIHEHLKIDFPVYLVFSKADLIAGFREYFALLTPQRRKAVWGVTFQTRNRQDPTWQQAEKEFEALLAEAVGRRVRQARRGDRRARAAGHLRLPRSDGASQGEPRGVPAAGLRADALRHHRHPARLLLRLGHAGRNPDRPGAGGHVARCGGRVGLPLCPAFRQGQGLLPGGPPLEGDLRRAGLGGFRRGCRAARGGAPHGDPRLHRPPDLGPRGASRGDLLEQRPVPPRGKHHRAGLQGVCSAGARAAGHRRPRPSGDRPASCEPPATDGRVRPLVRRDGSPPRATRRTRLGPRASASACPCSTSARPSRTWPAPLTGTASSGCSARA